MFNILQQQVRPPWAMALDRVQQEFAALQPLDAGTLAATAAWLLMEHVSNDLRLDGIQVTEDRLAELIIGATAPESPEERAAVNYAAAIRQLSDIVSAAEPATGAAAGPELTMDLLWSLHRLALGEEAEAAGLFRQAEINPLYPGQPTGGTPVPHSLFRQAEINRLYPGQPTGGTPVPHSLFRQAEINPLYPGHHPAAPREIPRLLELALEWFSADSIGELHPVEQAALVHLRLCDLQPFGKASGRTTRLATGLYTLRAGLPPIILQADDADAYYQALLTGFQMATQPLVELFARALGRTLRQMIELVKN
jgi:hypothetical protein